MKIIIENSSKIKATLPERDPTKMQEVFYNPSMVSNRNISVLLLNSIDNKKMNLALPLAGSGIRALRFLQELKKGKINQLFVNDKKDNFLSIFDVNLKLNGLEDSKKINLNKEDANLFLLNKVNKNEKIDHFCGYFDYIDLDPFGSPNPFLSAAIARISREGIIAITATDTAALSGTYPKVTKRKYWAKPLRNYLMHEIGLRILIRKIQLQGIQFDKALIPVLSYHKDHYFRIYFKNEKGKVKCDELLSHHKYFLHCDKCLNFKVSEYNLGFCECNNKFNFAGPLWIGSLIEKNLINKILKENNFPKESKFLQLLKEEANFPNVGFYDLHAICKGYKLEPKKMDEIMRKLEAVKTSFSVNGIKTKKKIEDIVRELK